MAKHVAGDIEFVSTEKLDKLLPVYPPPFYTRVADHISRIPFTIKATIRGVGIEGSPPPAAARSPITRALVLWDQLERRAMVGTLEDAVAERKHYFAGRMYFYAAFLEDLQDPAPPFSKVKIPPTFWMTGHSRDANNEDLKPEVKPADTLVVLAGKLKHHFNADSKILRDNEKVGAPEWRVVRSVAGVWRQAYGSSEADCAIASPPAIDDNPTPIDAIESHGLYWPHADPLMYEYLATRDIVYHGPFEPESGTPATNAVVVGQLIVAARG